LFHCRMWCYAIGVEAVVLRSWCVVWCTVCQLVGWPDWISLVQNMDIRRAVVNVVMDVAFS